MIKRHRFALDSVLVASLCALGCSGEDGARGPEGPAGPNGSEGTDGADGSNGQNGAQGPQGPQGATPWLSFGDVGFARTGLEKHQVRTASAINLNGTQRPLAFQTILRSNQDPARPNRACDLVASPSTCVGALLAANGTVMRDDANAPRVASNYNDFTSLLHVGTGKFLVNAFEETPASIYVTKLDQNVTTGALSAVSSRAVDLAPVNGLFRTCAGSITPWETHVAAEEAQVDARPVLAATSWTTLAAAVSTGRFGEIKNMARYLGLDLSDANNDLQPDLAYSAFAAAYTPYFHGYIVEIKVDAAGASTAAKHYAMGRLGFELGYVMPDRKTAFMTDDVDNGGLFMYVADQAGDLSAGTLYAMRVFQTSPAGGAFTADLEWISLGHATDAEVRALIPTTGARTAFTDMFDTAPLNADGISCPADFRIVRASGDGAALECLRVKPGQELAASRLETRRYANYVGATTELTKEEGLTYDPDLRRLYIALSDINGPMGAQTGGDNHITVAANRCGGVFALDVGPWFDASGTLVSELAPLNWYPLIAGTEQVYPATSAFAGNTCSIGGLASPDNLTYLPKYGVLMIGEDTSRHQNDALWAYHVASRRLTRIMTTPYGSEVTSPYWVPNFGGFGYLINAVQHPYTESDNAHAADPEAAGTASYIGVLGPFPALD